MCKELELLRGEKGVHVVWRRGSVQGLESEPDEENAHAWGGKLVKVSEP